MLFVILAAVMGGEALRVDSREALLEAVEAEELADAGECTVPGRAEPDSPWLCRGEVTTRSVTCLMAGGRVSTGCEDPVEEP
jgi:hypothetical protein